LPIERIHFRTPQPPARRQRLRRIITLSIFLLGRVLINAGIGRMSASLIGRLGSSTFRPSTNSGVDVAHRLALLFGLGTTALPSWDSKTRWNNLMGDLAVTVTAGSSGHTNSPHGLNNNSRNSGLTPAPRHLLR
jgi:hypothetical protein